MRPRGFVLRRWSVSVGFRTLSRPVAPRRIPFVPAANVLPSGTPHCDRVVLRRVGAHPYKISHPVALYRTPSRPDADAILIGNRLRGRVDLAALVRGFHGISHPSAPYRVPFRAFFELELPMRPRGLAPRRCSFLQNFVRRRTFPRPIAPYRTPSRHRF